MWPPRRRDIKDPDRRSGGDTPFLPVLVDVVDFWYRIGWQEHDSGHTHGLLWLKDAPNPEDIDWSLLNDHGRVIPEDQEEKMRQFVSFWGGITTATNPFPRVDKNTPLMGQHLCRLRNDTIRDTKEELGELLYWVERHRICRPGYCKLNARFRNTTNDKPFVPHGSPAAVSSATFPIQSDTCYTCLLLHFQETNQKV
jgi:hypothetical protein